MAGGPRAPGEREAALEAQEAVPVPGAVEEGKMAAEERKEAAVEAKRTQRRKKRKTCSSLTTTKKMRTHRYRKTVAQP